MRSFRSKASMIIAGTFVVYFFTGCAKPPEAELAAAKAAIQAAQTAEADKYMSKNFQGLKSAVESAEAEITEQNKAFFLNRKYKHATEMLIRATKVANEIAGEAPKIREQVLSQVKENLGIVKKLLTETAEDIKKASRSKDKSLIEELKADLSAADSAAAKAFTNFDAGDAIKASDDLETVQKLIKKITTALKPPTEPQI